MNYLFKLRPDMPRGFIENHRYPELPVMTQYLKQLDGKEFSTKKEFEDTLIGFQNYLAKLEVPLSNDERLREGLFLSDYHKKRGYIVFCYNNGMSGTCQFGVLGRIKQTGKNKNKDLVSRVNAGI